MFRLCIFDSHLNCHLDRQWRQYRDGSIEPLENPMITRVDSSDIVVSNVLPDDVKDGLPLIPQLEDGDIEFPIELDNKKKQNLSLEESRKLLIGITHSLKNTLCKLSLNPTLVKGNKLEHSNQSGSERNIDSPITEPSVDNDKTNSMINISPKSISPHPSLVQNAFNAGEFQSFSYKTGTYQLHYFETPTGWRFILQTPNPSFTQVSSKGTSKQKDMTKMFMALTMSTSSQPNESSSIAPTPPLVHIKMELFYELIVEHVIRHPFYILHTDNSVFDRVAFLRIIDHIMFDMAKYDFIPKLD